MIKGYGYSQLFKVLKGLKNYYILLIIGMITLVGVSVFDVYFPNVMRNMINDYIGGRIEIVNDVRVSVYPVKNSRQKEIFLDNNLEILNIDGRESIRFSDLKVLSEDVRKDIRKYDIQGIASRLKIIFIILVFYILVFFIHFFCINYIAQSMMYDLRQKVFSHLMRFNMKYFTNIPAGVLVTRVINDVEAINKFFSGVLINWLKDIIMFTGIAVMMFIINWRLSLILFFIVPVLTLLVLFYQKRLRDSYRKIRKTVSEMNAFLSENISGMFVVKSFTREKEGLDGFKMVNDRLYKAMKTQIMLRATFMPLINITRFFSIAVVLMSGGYLIWRGDMLFGDLVAFFTYIEMFFRPIRSLVDKFDLLQSAQAGLERVYTILSNTDDIEKKGGGEKLQFDESIEFCDVDFSYREGEKVLENIDFKIKKGEKVAFVGHTGAGKTTIINLITRFYDIDSGCIKIDGKNIYDIDLSELRSNIAYVPQDVFVFSDTVSYNMALTESPSEARLKDIINSVKMDNFIQKLPAGVNTVMLERGNSLSFGEKQLLAFSRALYSDPEIIVLDEATSNIDSNTEALIQNALEILLEDKTALIVAHRLSTIRNCDRIFVLKDGRIIEQGTHDELLANRGYYHRLYRLQYETQ